MLAVAPVASLVRLVLVRETLDLRATGGADHSGGHRGTTELRRRGEHGIAVHEHDRPQRDLVAVETLDIEAVAFDDSVLLSATLDHCVPHHGSLATPSSLPGGRTMTRCRFRAVAGTGKL